MINLCFLSGKVNNKIDLKFIYNSNTKSLSKMHTSIAWIDLEIEEEQIVKCYAYDEMADWIYQKIKKGDCILIQGSVRKGKVEISSAIEENFTKTSCNFISNQLE